MELRTANCKLQTSLGTNRPAGRPSPGSRPSAAAHLGRHHPHLEQELLRIDAAPHRVEVLLGNRLRTRRDVHEHALEVVEDRGHGRVARRRRGLPIQPVGRHQLLGAATVRGRCRRPRSVSPALTSSTSTICDRSRCSPRSTSRMRSRTFSADCGVAAPPGPVRPRQPSGHERRADQQQHARRERQAAPARTRTTRTSRRGATPPAPARAAPTRSARSPARGFDRRGAVHERHDALQAGVVLPGTRRTTPGARPSALSSSAGISP